MNKLILHIGLHKTGSTSIQNSLYLNRHKLAKLGWNLFCLNSRGKPNKVGNVNSWFNFVGTGKNFKAIVDPRLFEELERTNGNVILSSEEFAWFFSEEQNKYLYDQLSRKFSNIKLVVYLRRQDQHLLSHYQQGFRFQGSNARAFYGESLIPLPSHESNFSSYLNYYERIKMLSAVFGKENVITRIFEADKLHHSDVVQDFYYVLDIANQHFELPKINLNESISRFNFILNYCLFKYSPKISDAFQQVDWKEEKLGRFRLSKEDANTIISIYEKSNERLAKYLDNSTTDTLFSNNVSGLIDKSEIIKSDDVAKTLAVILKRFDDMSVVEFAKLKYLNQLSNSIDVLRSIYKKICK